ncbi:MAG: hypothetical protein ACREF6_21425, partial [Alphaproteobacteria bacterium]
MEGFATVLILSSSPTRKDGANDEADARYGHRPLPFQAGGLEPGASVVAAGTLHPLVPLLRFE